MSDLTNLGVKAIRDGVAKGDFTAREVAEAFNANVAAAKDLNAFIVATPERRSKPQTLSMRSAPRARNWAKWAACRSA